MSPFCSGVCAGRFLLWFPALLLGALVIDGRSSEPLALQSGDTIVWVGNTFVERAQRYGHLETAVALAAGPDVTDLKFRNLGWSGDSVFGDARSYFGPPSEGRDRLQKAVSEAKPNILMVCYGTGAAMSVDQGWTVDAGAAERSAAGEKESLALFVEGYGKLLDLMKGAAGDGLREVVLVSPPPLENLGAPLPDQTANNRRLAAFRDGIRALAQQRSLPFVDLFASMGGDDFEGTVEETPLTTNGVHYGDAGYELMARKLVEGLGLGFPEGLVAAGDEVDALRENVIQKNRLFFHRWRPANETYLFLFRKHEQGQNAKEIPMFDPLIAAKEKEIDEIRSGIFEGLRKR